MNIGTPERVPDAANGFYDFTLFSVAVVPPGSVLTPCEKRAKRPRATPLRKPTRRPTGVRVTRRGRPDFEFHDWHWRRGVVVVGKGQKKSPTPPGEEDEERRQWGALGKRVFNRWAEENEE